MIRKEALNWARGKAGDLAGLLGSIGVDEGGQLNKGIIESWAGLRADCLRRKKSQQSDLLQPQPGNKPD